MKLGTTSWVAILAVASLALAGCSASASGDSDTGGNAQLGENKVVYYGIGPNDSLDPLTPVNANSFAQAALMAVYDRLVEFDEFGNPIPGLAESWEFTNEELTEFELTIREGVTFHDGESLDAEAVTLNLQRSLDLQESASPAAQQVLNDITSVEAVGETTVRINLAQGKSGLPYDLGQQVGMMMSPASFAAGETGTEVQGIGAGPYTLVETVANQYTKFTAYADYWNGGVEDRAEFFEVHNVQGGQTRLNALRSGQADVIVVDAAVIDQAKHADMEISTFGGLGAWINYLNTSGVLSDKLIRQAMMYAIDGEVLAANTGGAVSVPTNQIFPPGTAIFDDARADEYAFDPQKARDLLAEAGHAGGVEVEFVLINQAENTFLFEALQQMWSDVGINLKVTTIDVSQFGEFVNGSLGDMMLAGWGGRADPWVTIQMLTGTGGTYAPAGAANPEIDALLAEAASIDPNDPRRNEVLIEANQVILEDAAVIPFMTRPIVFATQKDCIDGLVPYPAIASGYWANISKTDACR